MGIAYFPKLYEDELVYSVLARYYYHSGHSLFVTCAEDLYIKKTIRPDIEFINEVKPEVLELLCQNISIEELIEKHTMFPYYTRFLPMERRNRAFVALCERTGNYDNLLALPKSKNGNQRYLRYCPLCANEDREIYGETFWHRSHQMVGIACCSKHGCKLHNSTVLISSKASPSLIPAEQEVELTDGVIYDNEIEKELAKYTGDVFFAKVDMKNQVKLGEYLHSRLYGTEYVTARGEKRNIKKLMEDYNTFYKDTTNEFLLDESQMQKLFNGYRFNCIEICLMGLFLKIPVQDLCEMKLPEKKQEELFDEKIMELHKQGLKYPEIAKRLNASYDMVKTIGEGRYGTYSYRSNRPKKTRTASIDWNKMDEEYLPQVKKIVAELKGKGGVRPRRVNTSSVSDRLGIAEKSLVKLPKCMKLIEKNKVTQERYWAIEVIWAVEDLQRNGKSVNLTQIMKKTNMRKENLNACLSDFWEIAPLEVKEVFEKLI